MSALPAAHCAAMPSAVSNAPLIGWQTLLADLSLILFMVTSAAMASAPAAAPHAASRPPATVPRAEPLALWRAVPGGEGLGDWLASEAPDARQQLTVTAHYPPGAAGAALDALHATLEGAGGAASHARIVLEADGAPGAPLVTASLAYDHAPEPVPAAERPNR